MSVITAEYTAVDTLLENKIGLRHHYMGRIMKQESMKVYYYKKNYVKYKHLMNITHGYE